MRGIVFKADGDNILLVADTHVGYEAELRLRGIRAVSQTSRLLNNLKQWGEEAGANTLAILGDVKHELPTPRETAAEVRQFLKDLAKLYERVILIPGNHDGLLDEISQGIEGVYLADSRGVLLDGVKPTLLLHGHAKPRPEDLARAEVLVMGHTHPSVSIVDEIGYVTREHAIIKIKQNKDALMEKMYNKQYDLDEDIRIVILPASHPLITGFDIANLPQLTTDDRTILRYVDLRPELAEVYLTDFTFLGTLDLFLKERGGEESSRLEMVTS
ncbi:MAG: metallophosphoesterase [Thermoproteus sp.]